MVKVAIVIPTYCQKKYISTTLDSVLKQECNSIFKLYVNDDCSKDGTSEILLEYKNKYPHLIDLKINSENLGMPRNFFDLMKRVDADFFCLCGGDDWWFDEKKLQKQVNILESKPEVGLVYSDYYLGDENGQIVKEVKCPQASYSTLMKGNFICAASTCFRMSLFRQYLKEVNPLQYDWKMEDYPLLLWVSQQSSIYHLPETTTVYRIVQSSLTHVNNLKKRLDFEDTICQIRFFFNNKNNLIDANDIELTRDINKAHLCILSGDFEEYKKIAKKIKLINKKAVIYRLVGWSRFLFNHARKKISNS